MSLTFENQDEMRGCGSCWTPTTRTRRCRSGRRAASRQSLRKAIRQVSRANFVWLATPRRLRRCDGRQRSGSHERRCNSHPLDKPGNRPSLRRSDRRGRRRGRPPNPRRRGFDEAVRCRLWTRVKEEGSNIRRIEKEIADRDGYLTAARYRRGLLLLELKQRCVHGEFEAECKARKVKSQRASEDMRIAEYFPNEEEAGKVSVPRALAIIKRSDDSYGPYENCFACPQWLRDAVTRDYGFPGLDVAPRTNALRGEMLHAQGRRIGPGLDEGLRGEGRLVQPAL